MAPSITDDGAAGAAAEKKAGVEREQTALEAISLGDTMPGIPKFSSYAEQRAHILLHMAAVFRSWARHYYTEGQSGHISVRDPEFPARMWMNPLGRHFGMLTGDDMIQVDIETGEIVGGPVNPTTGMRTVNAAGYYIHSEIHKRRPDIHAVCHAHTQGGRAWAAFGRPLEMLTQDVCTFYGAHAVYDKYGGVVLAHEEGERIATALGSKNKGVILMNHGLLTVGETVDEASFLFGLLERSCDIQLRVEAASQGSASLQKRFISDEEAAYNFRVAHEPNVLYREAQPDIELEISMAGGADKLARRPEAI